tara:strand:+ start:125 stop:1045 length:921 start_codon:yes stop_codon:yes gene_type:complete
MSLFPSGVDSIIITLNDNVYIDGKLFYLNKTHTVPNEYIYETRVEPYIKFTISKPELYVNIVTIDPDIKPQFIIECLSDDLLMERLKLLNDERNIIYKHILRIILEITPNINTSKPQKNSHTRDVTYKIENNKSKTLFLWDLHNVNLEPLTNKINTTLKTKLTIDDDYESILVHLSLCHVIKILKDYDKYIKSCINSINLDIFNLHPMFINNNVLPIITPYVNRWFSEGIIYKSNEVFAIDNKNKCITDGIVLAFSSKGGKWNIFPQNKDGGIPISQDSVDNYKKILSVYNDANIDSFEKVLDMIF